MLVGQLAKQWAEHSMTVERLRTDHACKLSLHFSWQLVRVQVNSPLDLPYECAEVVDQRVQVVAACWTQLAASRPCTTINLRNVEAVDYRYGHLYTLLQWRTIFSRFCSVTTGRECEKLLVNGDEKTKYILFITDLNL
jgi:hypothetical protein